MDYSSEHFTCILPIKQSLFNQQEKKIAINSFQPIPFSMHLDAGKLRTINVLSMKRGSFSFSLYGAKNNLYEKTWSC